MQLVGQRSLFVHRLERLENCPMKGELIKISYMSGLENAKVERQETHRRVRGLQ